MITKLDQFAAPAKASIDTLFSLNSQAFESAEQLSALNLQTIKTVLAEAQETSHAALLAKSPAELLKLQTETLKAAPQKAVAYGRQVQAIFARIAEARRATLEAQIADGQGKFLDAVNGAIKGAPGAEKFLALAKSTVDAANKAYDGANTAAKQVSNTVTANVAKVTETTQRALATIEA
ncbi:phasin family protein [Variovorax sp. J22R115]|uniref:phasin family protein n=1 Tax=Variovorax sp. J22R115 TaxID=3053509 RepID=UPI0025773C6B|nr:phasin family protein [Variovorax sp. J22R115]MDM0053779.1 phasin family protein [Variovorax sp. J22R115]